VPGTTRPIGETEKALTIDDFRVGLRPDDTVEQYTADITVRDLSEKGMGDSRSASISVNHPATLYGMKFYQNSTGWAAKVQVYKEDSLVQEEILCAGEQMDVEDKEGLTLVFAAFYPDYEEGEDGMPRTASSGLKNPAYLYRLYYRGEILGMNVLAANEAITVDAYTIIFTDPQNYTLIQIKRDPFTWLAAIGAVVVMAGLILAFYLRTAEVYAEQKDGNVWSVSGYSRKGGPEFEDQLKQSQA
jgi:cytochrome c biogenesis protein ResB